MVTQHAASYHTAPSLSPKLHAACRSLLQGNGKGAEIAAPLRVPFKDPFAPRYSSAAPLFAAIDDQLSEVVDATLAERGNSVAISDLS